MRRIHPIFLWALFFSGISQAAPTCADRAKGFSELSLLDSELSGSLAKWSTDYLLRLVLDVEQNYLQHCPDGPRESSILRVKQAYLERLGVRLNRISPREQGLLFRGLISIEERSVPLKRSLVKKPSPRSALPYLKSIFKSASSLRGVVVLGGSKKERAQLEAFVADVCGSVGECRFWNPLSLYKVVLTDETSVAGYIGETAELVLSGELLRTDNLLHRVVLLHELTHAAERFTWLKDRRDWLEEYRALSGWVTAESGAVSAKVEVSELSRSDALTTLSKGSKFSILPDRVYLGVGGFDGFVLGKSYDESLAQKNPSEDLADHVAIYRLLPARFCLGGLNLAPRKWRWIGEKVFGQATELDCASINGASKAQPPHQGLGTVPSRASKK